MVVFAIYSDSAFALFIEPRPQANKPCARLSATFRKYLESCLKMKRFLYLAFIVLSLVANARPALAGPPYQLDDPDVIPYKWHEFYVWGGAAISLREKKVWKK